MAEFKSWLSFTRFAKVVRERTRCIHDAETQDFLNTVWETAKPRVEPLPVRTQLFRAQLGHDWKPSRGDRRNRCCFKEERMKPCREFAAEGRANPKGIVYLYLATTRDTAIGEVRPWIGSYVSLGVFETHRELKIVNCATADPLVRIPNEELTAPEREFIVWSQIDEAFARPVTRNDSAVDYVPTQIIAEVFRDRGVDGIRYRSSLEKGQNIVLFDTDAACMSTPSLYQVIGITLEVGHRPSSLPSCQVRDWIEEKEREI